MKTTHQILNSCIARSSWLQPGASIKEVKDRYRRLALKHHPDRSYSHAEGEKFKLETEDYHTLLNYYKNHIYHKAIRTPESKKILNLVRTALRYFMNGGG